MKAVKLKLVTYVGGYKNLDKPGKCNVTVSDKGFKLERILFGFRKKTIVEVGWDKIKNVTVMFQTKAGALQLAVCYLRAYLHLV